MVILDTFNMVGCSEYWGGASINFTRWLSAIPDNSNTLPSWPQLKGRFVVGTYRGRTAIALTCKIFGLGPGDEILVPAFNCGTEIDALLASGVDVTAYRVRPDTLIDFDDLISRRSTRTRAIYVIHYFGWEQPLLMLRQFCDMHNLILIEDCALALFSDGTSGLLGRVGDAAIYSLPKSLGTHHGGLLSLAAQFTDRVPMLHGVGISTLLSELKKAMRVHILYALTKIGALNVTRTMLRLLRPELMAKNLEGFPDMPRSYYFNQAIDYERAAHPSILAVARYLPWEDIVRNRQKNYLYLAEHLTHVNCVQLLFPSLPNGICPLLMPLLVQDRDECVRRLQDAGIESFPWWAGFHRGTIDWLQFPDACRLKQSILTVPVHQQLACVDKLVDVVTNVLSNVRTAEIREI